MVSIICQQPSAAEGTKLQACLYTFTHILYSLLQSFYIPTEMDGHLCHMAYNVAFDACYRLFTIMSGYVIAILFRTANLSACLQRLTTRDMGSDQSPGPGRTRDEPRPERMCFRLALGWSLELWDTVSE